MTTAISHILVVEDEQHIRRFVRTALESEAYQVTEAGTCAQGLQDIRTQRLDMLILDLGLPDGDGVQLIQTLRTWSKLPVLVLSARSADQDKIKALDAGADDYLSKPFSTGELLARVRALLRRRPEGVVAEAQLSFGDFEIDCVRRTVSKAGMPLHLTQIEYRLLAYLAAHPGRVLTHRHLLAQVWGGQAVENHQYLRVYVGHLRQKIESNPAQPRHILTEIGVGYRFQL